MTDVIYTKVARSSVTGRFVKKTFAHRRPDITVVETMRYTRPIRVASEKPAPKKR